MMKQSLIPDNGRVLLTRPDQNSRRFAQDLIDALAPATAEIIISPLMQAQFLPTSIENRPYQELILTSETGAQAAAQLRQTGVAVPDIALCVGARTALVAQSLGFTAVSAQGDARDLLVMILSRPNPGPMLYLHGKNRAADLESALNGQRDITSYAVYSQEPQALTAQALAALAINRPLIVPLFSPRSAQLFLAQLPQDYVAALKCVTISANTTAALPPKLAKDATEADHPDAPAMLRATLIAIQDTILGNGLKPIP